MRLIAPTALLLLPTVMMAHEGHDHGLAAGFAHPWLGMDHLLAMVATGLLALRLGGHARWQVPATFLTAMGLGGALGVAGLHLPGAEWGIALSLVLLGTLLAWKRAPTTWIAAAIIAPFALCHGAAHGAEMPLASDGVSYVAGFLLATAALHAAGLGTGLLIARAQREGALRLAGAALAVMGAMLAL